MANKTRVHHRVAKKMDSSINSLVGFMILFAFVALFFFIFQDKLNF